MNNKRQIIRKIVNICIAVTVFAAWAAMAFSGGGSLAEKGIGSLKYFTLQSNILAAVASVMWLICERKGGSVKVERLKYVAAAAVALTFMTIMVFLGPIYGYVDMLSGANFWFHLVVPIMAMAEIIFLSDASYTRRDNNLTLIPPILYGIYYLLNIFINGMGEWPDSNDWYLFLRWGYPVGMVIFAIICVVTWLMAFLMRKLQGKANGDRAAR